MPGPDVAVITFKPAMDAPRQAPMDAISSSAWRQTPPRGGSSESMVFSMVVAGVIGYPAKKRHPAATAPRATASFPSSKVKDMGFPYLFYCLILSK
jgi:hypothetical protein